MYLLKRLLSPEGSKEVLFDPPRRFREFLRYLGIEPTRGQSELIRVAYDAGSPVDRELGRKIFGGLPMDEGKHFRVVCAVCGARAGKSYLLIALRMVWGMLVRDLRVLAPGQRACAMVVAPNDRLRREVLNYALGAFRSKEELRKMVVRESVDSFEIERPDGRRVYFECGVATSGGYGARGRWFTDFALDECAFFRDASSKVNDQDIFNAGTTRVLPGGQTIVASTPWAQAGLLYELYRDHWGKGTDVVVAHAPTLLLNDSETTRAVVSAETQRDPDNAAREYGAEFLSAATTLFFDGAALDAALDEEEYIPRPGVQIMAGVDFGFRADSSALVMCAIDDGAVHIFDGVELRPGKDAPLKPSETVAQFAEVIRGRTSYLVGDGHYREAISELLCTHGLAYGDAPTSPADTYVRARMLLRDGRVRIHPTPFRERLMRQLREVRGKPTASGGMSIVHPRWATGGHGDLAAAFVLALWQVVGDEVASPLPEFGSKDWERLRREKRQEDMVRKKSEKARWWAK